FSQTPEERYEERLDLMSSEIREMKRMMTLATLNQSSAHERMRAIHRIRTSGTVDEGMIALLLDTLGHDSNANVRLVALEALAAHADVPGAREGLVQSLDRQESPLVQLALTDVIVRLNEKQAVGHFRRILQQKDLNDVVRTRINDSLKILM
ncbi:MAG: HEAT repeat domain-containing protein, partial [candidate division WOR-3 bacterium]